jgi:hypothetical protein
MALRSLRPPEGSRPLAPPTAPLAGPGQHDQWNSGTTLATGRFRALAGSAIISFECFETTPTQ